MSTSIASGYAAGRCFASAAAMCFPRSTSSSLPRPREASLTNAPSGKVACARTIAAASRRTSAGEKNDLSVKDFASANGYRIPELTCKLRLHRFVHQAHRLRHLLKSRGGGAIGSGQRDRDAV